MHTTTITQEQWAMIWEELKDIKKIEVGKLWVTGGIHPTLGDLSLTEAAIGGALFYTLTSERPLSVLFWPKAA